MSDKQTELKVWSNLCDEMWEIEEMLRQLERRTHSLMTGDIAMPERDLERIRIINSHVWMAECEAREIRRIWMYEVLDRAGEEC